MDLIITTLLKRPYVFLFLIAFLFLAIRHMGLVKTLIWLATGYLIAFLSEFSSIHNGFPYGEYHYIYENLKGELILAGVPVWDSLSYSFMTYASYATVLYAAPKLKGWKQLFAGALLTMILDVITDPVAKLGNEWFLGEIYYYANNGWYFGVPFSNFAGWFLVAFVIIGVNMLIGKLIPKKTAAPAKTGISRNVTSILHPLFYISICLFNTAIAFMIGHYLLGTVNLLITLLITITCLKVPGSKGTTKVAFIDVCLPF